MSAESFEDDDVAKYLNEYFVSIKVDKEERPDVDSIYMAVCQNLTGSGGWPLTIFMLPDQKPFFAGTYFPKKSKYNMPGFLDLIEAIHDKWENSRNDLVESSETIMNSLKVEYNTKIKDFSVTKELTEKATKHLSHYFDKEYGGFGRAPKFPTPHNLLYLLRDAYYEGNKDSLKIVMKTLDSMYCGGIFDHIGYGFSRYSTDNKWLVPHFEKMLYDNALLIIAYLETYQITRKSHFKQIAEMTMDYVVRELTDENGGFYCAEDADSEGTEGKYYVFTPDEILTLLGDKEGTFFNVYYGITQRGNFEGFNIPNRIHMKNQSLDDNDLESDRIKPLRKMVFDYRTNRTVLHKDDKILTSWNSLMIVAFAKAYQILGELKYLNTAIKANKFIQDKLCHNNRLYVHYRDGKSIGNGHIDDYSFYIWALISLYEATFECKYLELALKYTDILIDQFYDKVNGGFFLYAKDAEKLIHRPKEIYDGAIPSGNSVAAFILLKLSSYTGNVFLSQIADEQIKFIVSQISEYPSSHSFALMAVQLLLNPTKELISITQNDDKELKKFLSDNFIPNITVLIKSNENKEQLESIAKFTENYKAKENKTTYYLCENHACMSPVTDLKKLEAFIIKNN
ncbi:MAG: hypothetical protein K0S41_2600 [Anaerocolumna sp.]|jgi:uncharacterized protein YyaL (SSP411 family)|nr:hypothetical protein [Anaerocolumna sp.]